MKSFIKKAKLMIDKAIVNGKVYLDSNFVNANVYIDNGKIHAISHELFPANELIDATGLHVIPGIIDPHVHFDLDLGLHRSIDDFENGSMIAALGGVTTIIDFLDPVANEFDLEKAYRKRLFEAEDSRIDYKFHATIKNPSGDLEAFVQKMLSLGMNSLKCFTTYSDSNRMTSDYHIVELLKLSQKYKFLLMVHAENEVDIDQDPSHTFRDLSSSRPSKAEINKVRQLASYLRQFGGYLYVVHTSSGETIETIKETYPELINKHLFFESCPQYFLFNDQKLKEDDGYLYTFTPPLRSERERIMLQENIDYIQTIGTDHCAFKAESKNKEYLNEIPQGIGSIEHSFDMMYQMFNEKIIDKMTKNVALLHFLDHKKGKIKVGYDADLFFYSLEKGKVESDHSLSGYSIYMGLPKSGKVVSTMVRGEFVVRDEVFEPHLGIYQKAGEVD